MDELLNHFDQIFQLELVGIITAVVANLIIYPWYESATGQRIKGLAKDLKDKSASDEAMILTNAIKDSLAK